MHKTLAIIALLLSAVSSWATGPGVTTHNQINKLADGRYSRTTWIVYNNTAYDWTVTHVLGAPAKAGPAFKHRPVSGTGALIGETTVSSSTSGGGGNKLLNVIQPSAPTSLSVEGGGVTIMGDETTAPSPNGYTITITNPSLAIVTTIFVRDPWTCGTIFYSINNGQSRFDHQILNPCPGSGVPGAPMPSSMSVAPPSFWKPEWMKKSGG